MPASLKNSAGASRARVWKAGDARIGGGGAAEPIFLIGHVRIANLAALPGALTEQPGDDVHQPGRDFERFTGEGDAAQRIVGSKLSSLVRVEIGSRLIRHHHRLHIEAID